LRPCWRGAGGATVPGHPVVLGRALWPPLMRLTGDRGARGMFAEHPEWVREIELDGSPPLDVDDRDDYRRARIGG
jgi:molybdenum cofactor cytidylyltransferase